MSATERSTTKTVVIAALALLVTFVAGFIVGAVTHRFMIFHGRPHRPPPMATFAMMNRLERNLDLSDEQSRQVRAILEKHHERIRGEVQSEIETANAEIEKILNPEQRVKFQELKMRLGPGIHRGDRPRRGPTR